MGYPQVRVRWARQRLVGATIRGDASEKGAKLAQKLGQLQPYILVAVLSQECTGQLLYFGPT